MGFEFKMSGDWFPETPETFAELQSLAHDEPEIWDAICDPRQNDWRQFLEHVEKCGEEYRVGLLEQICHDAPNACGGLLMRILKADEAELRSEGLKKEINQEEEKQKQRAKEEAEAKALEDALRNGTCRETGICRTITLPGGATMEMIYCPPGEFMMGSPASEAGRDDDEVQHRVKLTKAFWLGKYAVTQRQWKDVMGNNPSHWDGGNLPVENVSWEYCQKFIDKVNAQLKCGARLPTEAEWEYACRAGTNTAYSWGDVLNGDKANCNGNYHPYGIDEKGEYLERTVAVDKYAPNPWGFYCMHGNVWEWCSDWYDADYYKWAPSNDPQGPASGKERVRRGGSWLIEARYGRSANRSGDFPGNRFHYCGFRLCCSAGPRKNER